MHPRGHGKGCKSELQSKPPDPPTRETQAFKRGQSDQAGSAIYIYMFTIIGATDGCKQTGRLACKYHTSWASLEP